MSEWISVNDRLPAMNKPVLVTDGEIIDVASRTVAHHYPKGYYWFCEYADGYDVVWTLMSWSDEDENVTHWAELPDLPKDCE